MSSTFHDVILSISSATLFINRVVIIYLLFICTWI